MKVINSYGFKALYDSVLPIIQLDDKYFFILQDTLLDIYKIDTKNNISLQSKVLIENHNYISAFAFMNAKYIWFLLVDSSFTVYEVQVDFKNDKILHQTINEIYTNEKEVPISIIEKNNVVTIFNVKEHSNILYGRQISTTIDSPVYHLSEKFAHSVLPDIYEFKFDKVNLIINFDLKRYL